jgi:RNA polymerase sigma-70 factor (ECF subfamily)
LTVTGEVEAIDPVTPAFETFYTSTRTTVGRALAVTLRDAELAADAVDEAMIRAYQHWDRVGHLDNPAGWTYRIGLDYARSRLRRRRGREELLHPPGHHHDGPVVDPAIDDALAGLPTKQRAVVVCRLLLGWSEAQTSATLGIRAGTVKSRLHRALGTLQVELDHLREEQRP